MVGGVPTQCSQRRNLSTLPGIYIPLYIYIFFSLKRKSKRPGGGRRGSCNKPAPSPLHCTLAFAVHISRALHAYLPVELPPLDHKTNTNHSPSLSLSPPPCSRPPPRIPLTRSKPLFLKKHIPVYRVVRLGSSNYKEGQDGCVHGRAVRQLPRPATETALVWILRGRNEVGNGGLYSTHVTFYLLLLLMVLFKKNQNAPRPSDHPPVKVKKCVIGSSWKMGITLRVFLLIFF